MVFMKDGVILSLLFMVKSYLYLIKSANLVFRNNCTVLSLNMTSHSLPFEQVPFLFVCFLGVTTFMVVFSQPSTGL